MTRAVKALIITAIILFPLSSFAKPKIKYKGRTVYIFAKNFRKPYLIGMYKYNPKTTEATFTEQTFKIINDPYAKMVYKLGLIKIKGRWKLAVTSAKYKIEGKKTELTWIRQHEKDKGLFIGFDRIVKKFIKRYKIRRITRKERRKYLRQIRKYSKKHRSRR